MLGAGLFSESEATENPFFKKIIWENFVGNCEGRAPDEILIDLLGNQLMVVRKGKMGASSSIYWAI